MIDSSAAMRMIKTCKKLRWGGWLAGLAFLVSMDTIRPAFAADTKPQSKGIASSKTCQAKAADLLKWLAAYASGIDRQPAFIALPDEINLVSIDRPPTAVDMAVVARLSPNGTWVEGEAVHGGSAVLVERIRTALARQQALAQLTGQPLAQTLLLAVDRRTIWRRVVETVDAAAAAGAEKVQLAFRSTRTPRVPNPGPSVFDQRLKTIRQAKDPSARSEEIGNMSSALVLACAPLQAPLTAMAKRGGVVPEAFVKAILDCQCAADVASIKTLIWSVHPPLPGTLVPLTLARDTPQSPPLIAEGNLAWAAAHQLVLKAIDQDAEKPVRLQARGPR